MKVVAIPALLVLSSCAMSAAGLEKGAIERSWTSPKPPQQVAGCVAETLIGSNPLFEKSPGHFVLVRNNGYGVPTTRYDIYVRDGVTAIDLRSSISVNRGTAKVEACL